MERNGIEYKDGFAWQMGVAVYRAVRWNTEGNAFHPRGRVDGVLDAYDMMVRSATTGGDHELLRIRAREFRAACERWPEVWPAVAKYFKGIDAPGHRAWLREQHDKRQLAFGMQTHYS